ncbi:MAG: hypothetical protein LKI07_12770 [Heyndrickxia oleronia]|jgi:hypothetical protein|nr:hypothetical protein [Heyndrickxia oleronia]
MRNTVVAQNYSTVGNGGRKLIKLRDGTLVAAVFIKETEFKLFKLLNGEETWKLVYGSSWGGIKDISITPLNDGSIGVLISRTINGSSSVSFLNLDLNGNYVSNAKIVDTGQYEIGKVSIITDQSSGYIHAAWSKAVNSNTSNIFYGKSLDGGVTWNIKPVTAENSGPQLLNPSIVLYNNKPIILAQFRAYIISAYINRIYSFWEGPTSGSGVNIATGWSSKIIHAMSADYLQVSPSAIVDKDGVIHLVWQGTDTSSTVPKIRYSKSINGGISWSTHIGIINGFNPSITIDKQNNLFILFDTGASIGRLTSLDSGESWTNFYIISNSESNINPSTLYDPTFSGIFEDTPSTIYMAGNRVDFIGTYSSNNIPTVKLNTVNNFTLSENEGQNELIIDGYAKDIDPNNTVVVKMQISDGTIRNIQSGISDGLNPIEFSKKYIYSNKRIYDGATSLTNDLAENVDHTLKVWVDDGQGGISVIEERYFRVIHNRPPVISGTDEDLGELLEIPLITYLVDDPEKQATTITERINGQVIQTFDAELGKEYQVVIPLEMWLPLQLDQEHIITIEAKDSFGARSNRTYTFTRIEDTILVELKDPFITDIAATRLLVTPDVYLPIGSTIVIEACNNAFDENPTWEDITGMAMNKRGFNFENTEKTAEQWGINIRFTLHKGTAHDQVRFNGFGGAFD